MRWSFLWAGVKVKWKQPICVCMHSNHVSFGSREGKFHAALQSVLDSKKDADLRCVLGDFDARVGRDDSMTGCVKERKQAMNKRWMEHFKVLLNHNPEMDVAVLDRIPQQRDVTPCCSFNCQMSDDGCRKTWKWFSPRNGWHATGNSQIAMMIKLFRKGDPTSCGNHRGISLQWWTMIFPWLGNFSPACCWRASTKLLLKWSRKLNVVSERSGHSRHDGLCETRARKMQRTKSWFVHDFCEFLQSSRHWESQTFVAFVAQSAPRMDWGISRCLCIVARKHLLD